MVEFSLHVGVPHARGKPRTQDDGRKRKLRVVFLQSLRHANACHLPLHKGGFKMSITCSMSGFHVANIAHVRGLCSRL